jgi:hypothetical protein
VEQAKAVESAAAALARAKADAGKLVANLAQLKAKQAAQTAHNQGPIKPPSKPSACCPGLVNKLDTILKRLDGIEQRLGALEQRAIAPYGQPITPYGPNYPGTFGPSSAVPNPTPSAPLPR